MYTLFFRWPLAAPDKVHDLDLVAFADLGCLERGALQHHEVVLDSDAPGVDLELLEEAGDGQGSGDLERITVDHDFQVITPLRTSPKYEVEAIHSSASV